MKRDDRIDYLKAVACFWVVCCHVFISRGTTGSDSKYKYWSSFWLLAYTICNPLFFAIAGWLNHEDSLLVYLKKKTKRILVPFCVFSLLKILYTTFISSYYSHNDSVLIQLVDAFIFGRLYWFAYAILGVMLLAPLFWKLSNINLFVMFVVSIGLSMAAGCFTSVFQIKAVFSLLPCFIVGMMARRISRLQVRDSRVGRLSKYGVLILSCIGTVFYIGYIFSHETSYAIPNRIPYFMAAASLILPIVWGVAYLPQGVAWLAFVGRNSWPIMLLDPFFKAILVQVFDSSYSTFLVIMLDITLSALICRLLMRVPGRFLFGVSSR